MSPVWATYSIIVFFSDTNCFCQLNYFLYFCSCKTRDMFCIESAFFHLFRNVNLRQIQIAMRNEVEKRSILAYFVMHCGVVLFSACPHCKRSRSLTFRTVEMNGSTFFLRDCLSMSLRHLKVAPDT